jgi:hypothetical protein
LKSQLSIDPLNNWTAPILNFLNVNLTEKRLFLN